MERIYAQQFLPPSSNASTTPFQQWGFWQFLLFSWTTIRGKHCRHPITVMGAVDTFGPRHLYKNSSFANLWYLSYNLELAIECPEINSRIYETLKDAAQLPGRIFPINLWLSSSSFCSNNDTSKSNTFYTGVKVFFKI